MGMTPVIGTFGMFGIILMGSLITFRVVALICASVPVIVAFLLLFVSDLVWRDG